MDSSSRVTAFMSGGHGTHPFLRKVCRLRPLRRARPVKVHRTFMPSQASSPIPSYEKQNRTQKRPVLLWRRAWDSNPRGLSALLAFQASSLATRSTLRVQCLLSEMGLFNSTLRVYNKHRGKARTKSMKALFFDGKKAEYREDLPVPQR